VDGFVDITTDGLYTWTFDVTGATILPVGDWHIGGQYCNGDPDNTDCKGWIISTSAPGEAVPEPSAALIFGAALLVAAPRLRRRR
jgi:MYXO-CTERM domain-containing protein